MYKKKYNFKIQKSIPKGHKRGEDINSVDELLKAMNVNTIQEAKIELGCKLSIIDRIILFKDEIISLIKKNK